MVQVNPLTREILVKLVYYGPGLGGKTSSLQYVHQSAPPEVRGQMVSLATPVDRTLYFDFLPLRLPRMRDYQVRLQLFTVPGQVYFDATRKLVLTGADGVMFVADSQPSRQDANLESFENLMANLKEQGKRLSEFPHVIQFNKRDLGDAAPLEEMEAALNLYGAPSFGTSATRGDGILEALDDLVRAVRDDLEAKELISSGQESAEVHLGREDDAFEEQIGRASEQIWRDTVKRAVEAREGPSTEVRSAVPPARDGGSSPPPDDAMPASAKSTAPRSFAPFKSASESPRPPASTEPQEPAGDDRESSAGADATATATATADRADAGRAGSSRVPVAPPSEGAASYRDPGVQVSDAVTRSALASASGSVYLTGVAGIDDDEHEERTRESDMASELDRAVYEMPSLEQPLGAAGDTIRPSAPMGLGGGEAAYYDHTQIESQKAPKPEGPYEVPSSGHSGSPPPSFAPLFGGHYELVRALERDMSLGKVAQAIVRIDELALLTLERLGQIANLDSAQPPATIAQFAGIDAARWVAMKKIVARAEDGGPIDRRDALFAYGFLIDVRMRFLLLDASG